MAYCLEKRCYLIFCIIWNLITNGFSLNKIKKLKLMHSNIICLYIKRLLNDKNYLLTVVMN